MNIQQKIALVLAVIFTITYARKRVLDNRRGLRLHYVGGGFFYEELENKSWVITARFKHLDERGNRVAIDECPVGRRDEIVARVRAVLSPQRTVESNHSPEPTGKPAAH